MTCLYSRAFKQWSMVLNLLRSKELLCGIPFQVTLRPYIIVHYLSLHWPNGLWKVVTVAPALYVDLNENVCISTIIIIIIIYRKCVPNIVGKKLFSLCSYWSFHPRLLNKVLSYLILPYLTLPRLVSSRLVSSRLVSSRLVSSRLVSSRLVSSRLVSSRLVSSRLVSSRLVSSRLVSSRLVSSRLVSSRLVSSRLVSSRLVSSRLVSSRLVSSRLVSSRLVSSRLVSSRLVSSRLVSSRLVSPRLASPRLASPRLVSSRLVSSRLVSSYLILLARKARSSAISAYYNNNRNQVFGQIFDERGSLTLQLSLVNQRC